MSGAVSALWRAFSKVGRWTLDHMSERTINDSLDANQSKKNMIGTAVAAKAGRGDNTPQIPKGPSVAGHHFRNCIIIEDSAIQAVTVRGWKQPTRLLELHRRRRCRNWRTNLYGLLPPEDPFQIDQSDI